MLGVVDVYLQLFDVFVAGTLAGKQAIGMGHIATVSMPMYLIFPFAKDGYLAHCNSSTSNLFVSSVAI